MATNTVATKQTHTAANNASGNTSGPYTISFDYLVESDVEVRVDNTLKTQTTHYTFPSKTSIQFTSGNFPTAGAVIEIKRNTDITVPKVDFQDGSVLTESDLDNNSKHLLFGMQETKEDVEGLVNSFVGASAPTGTNIVNGSRWYDTVSGRTFVYYQDVDTAQWVEANPPFDATEAVTTASRVNFVPSGSGAVTRTVDSKLEDIIHVEDFGAVGNGTTDDTTAFQNAINFVAGLGGGTVHFGSKKYLIDTALEVKDYVDLKGPHDGGPDELLTNDTVTVDGESNAANYDKMGGQLIINSSITITFRDSAGLCGALVMRKGLDLPFTTESACLAGLSAFSGTALTVGGAGTYFKQLLILGFNTAIFSTGNERVGIDFVKGDCNNGIDIRSCFDIAYVSNCHFWPFTTTHQTALNGLAGRQLVRSGKAYFFSDVADWCKLTNCFSYGYHTGFTINNCNDVQLIGCGADWVGTIAQSGTFNYANGEQVSFPTLSNTQTAFTSIGFKITGTCLRTKLIGCQTAAQLVGYFVNISNAAPGEIVNFSQCTGWDNDQRHVNVTNGRTHFNLCAFTDANSNTNDVGIHIEDTADKSSIIQCDFENINDPIRKTADDIVLHNTFINCGSTDHQDPDSQNLVTTLGSGSFIGNNSFAQNLKIKSSDSSGEGGEIQLERAADNTYVYAIDVNGTGTSNAGSFRIIDNVAGSARMVIDSNGNMLVGNPSPTLTARLSLENNGFVQYVRCSGTGGGNIPIIIERASDDGVAIEFKRAGAVVGNINVTSTTTNYVTSSDYRLKENITTISNGITRLKTLKPYRFNFKVDASKTVDGFLAHEVSSVVPEAITGTKDEVDSDNKPIYQGIDQSKLVPLLVASLQEAIAKIESLEARVASLEG